MRIRLGYVAIALRLKDCSPSKTVTLKNLAKIPDYHDQLSRLTLACENLTNTLRVLKANFYEGISFYRFTSRLIPCHPPLILSLELPGRTSQGVQGHRRFRTRTQYAGRAAPGSWY